MFSRFLFQEKKELSSLDVLPSASSSARSIAFFSVFPASFCRSHLSLRRTPLCDRPLQKDKCAQQQHVQGLSQQKKNPQSYHQAMPLYTYTIPVPSRSSRRNERMWRQLTASCT
jgi:hypothetical protein